MPLVNLCLLQDFNYSSPESFADSLRKSPGSATSSRGDLERVASPLCIPVSSSIEYG